MRNIFNTGDGTRQAVEKIKSGMNSAKKIGEVAGTINRFANTSTNTNASALERTQSLGGLISMIASLAA